MVYNGCMRGVFIKYAPHQEGVNMAKASTTGVKTHTAAQQAIKDQMAANSIAWHSADPTEQARLADANKALAGTGAETGAATIGTSVVISEVS